MDLQAAELWFPKYSQQESRDFVSDISGGGFEFEVSIFDQPGMVHTQLTPGVSHGRVLFAGVGRVMLVMEFYSQGVEKTFATPSDMFAFCLVLNGTGKFVANGKHKPKDMVYIAPPGGETTIVAPPDAITLAFLVERNALLGSLAHEPALVDWLTELDRNGKLVRSAHLVQTLRDRMFTALETALNTTDLKMRAVIDEIALRGIASALTLEWFKNNSLSIVDRALGFQRFERARELLINDGGLMDRVKAGATSEFGSQRSLEKAFSDFAYMSPMVYRRVIHLHNARRKLVDPGRLADSIGDIAAEEGFWDWSRFTSYYRKHFGELPSQTRAQALGQAA